MSMRSVERALEVLECIADLQPVGVSQIARHLDEPKSSIQRAIDTLAKGRWITRRDSEAAQWSIALRTSLLCRRFDDQGGVGPLALDAMEHLREQTGETIHLAIPRGTSVILIERLESRHPVRYVEPLGGAASIFLTATGKSILAHLPEDEFETIVSEESKSLTDSGLTPDGVRKEIARVRSEGYATTDQWRNDVFAVAAAILDQEGQPVAAVSISAPASRVGTAELTAYPQLATTAAKEISRLIQRC